MKYVIFHGAYGNKNGNWFPYLKENLESLGQQVILEQFPVENFDAVSNAGPTYEPKYQSLSNWLSFFETKILPGLKSDDELSFIGHSAGPVFILHLIEKYNLQLDSAIFVMPFMKPLNRENAWKFDLVNKTFYKNDFDFKKLQKLIPISYVLYTDNDLYVDPQLSLDFAEKLKSSPILIKGAKHINGKEFAKMPFILELCKTRLDPQTYLNII